MFFNDKYTISQGYECLSACLSCVLGYYNSQVTPSTIVLLGNGVQIRYTEKDNILTTDIYKANYNFLDRFKLQYEVKRIYSRKSFDNINSQLKKELDDGYLPIIKLKSHNLSYNRVFSQSENAVHYTCLTGYDKENYYICDSYIPTKTPSTFEGLVDKKNLLNAFAEDECKYIILKDANNISNININTLLKTEVLQEINSYITGGISADCYYGIDAVLRMFDNIAFRGIDNTKEELINYNYQLKVYGFISLKYIIIEIMSRFTKQFNEELNYILKEWNSIAMYMIKCGFMNKVECYQKLLNRVKSCSEREVEVMKKCIALLD